VDSPMDVNSKHLPDQGKVLDNPRWYRRRVGKLNYLTLTRSYIAYPLSIVSQFLSPPQTNHWDVVIQIPLIWRVQLAEDS